MINLIGSIKDYSDASWKLIGRFIVYNQTKFQSYFCAFRVVYLLVLSVILM